MQTGYTESPKVLNQDTQTELDVIHQRLSKCNSENVSLLQEVDDKLHKILNKRTPENAAKQETAPSPNDFVSAVHQQLNYYESHNSYLSRILSHLSQIA